MRQQLGRVPVLPLLAAALVLGGAAVMAAQAAPAEPFEEAELFIELNDTDGDLGIHASIDGEAVVDILRGLASSAHRPV